jgi:hypothetical protein
MTDAGSTRCARSAVEDRAVLSGSLAALVHEGAILVASGSDEEPEGGGAAEPSE